MGLQVLLSAVEVVLFVGVLIYFLRRIDILLGQVQSNLAKIAEGTAAIEGHCAIIGPGTDELNRILAKSAAGLTLAAEEAESMA